MSPSKATATTIHAGMLAPSFVLQDQHRAVVDSVRLLARGPLVVFFFRALDCDYCRRELAAVERAATSLQSCGASIVGISHYLVADAASAGLDMPLSFSMLNDRSGAVMDAFGLRPGSGWNPLSARFVIAPNGMVAYGDADPDYTRRPDAAELAPVVWRLATTFKSLS